MVLQEYKPEIESCFAVSGVNLGASGRTFSRLDRGGPWLRRTGDGAGQDEERGQEPAGDGGAARGGDAVALTARLGACGYGDVSYFLHGLVFRCGSRFRGRLRWFCRRLVSEYKCAPMGGNIRQIGFQRPGSERASVTYGWTRWNNAERRIAVGRNSGNRLVVFGLFH